MAVTMLIVDDSSVMRSVIIKIIRGSEYQGAEIFEASNGQEALAILKESSVDLVITDFSMPLMNGMELIAAMKKYDGLLTIPSLVVTTEGSRQTIKKFMAAGAAGFLQKPFTPQAIREKISALLGEVKDEESGNSDEGLDF
jgi:two-component system chemotaxis response regulator CheY